MDFIRLRAQNFLTIGDTGDIFLCGRGLNLLQGVNLDDPSAKSNGSGKSSIVDALSWGSYGVTARGESTDGVVNVGAKKNCVVEIELKDGDTAYLIKRHRKHATEKNALLLTATDGAGRTQSLTKGTDRETQIEVERVIGCSYEVFVAAIYAGQEAMPDLPAMTDKPLKLLIEEAAGVQKMEGAYEIARRELQQTEQQYNVQLTELARAQQQLGAVRVELERSKLAHDKVEQEREGLANSYLDAAGVTKLQAADIVRQLRAQDEPALVAENTRIATELASIREVRRAADLYAPVLASVSRESDAADALVKRLTNEALALRARFDNAPAELAKPCGTCGKPHTPDELEQFKAHTRELLVSKIEEIKQATAQLAPRRAAFEAGYAEQERLRDLVPDATELSARQVPINAALTQIAQFKAQARALIDRATALNGQAEFARTAPNPQAALVTNLEARIAALVSQETKLQAELVTLSDAVEVAKSVALVFGPAGVRAHILDTVTPFLNERTADYLGTLSDGNISATWSTLSRNARGELKEKFAIEVDNAKGAKTFKGLSGGEKRKVRLATMMALQDLTASRASKPLNLWLGDEVDEALDEAGLERLMAILDKKARERGTVIVISHNSLTDWIDNVTTITKQGGMSKVTGALTEAL